MHFCRVLGPRQHGSVLIEGPSLVQRPRTCWQLALPKLGVTVVFGTPSFCDWLGNQCCHPGGRFPQACALFGTGSGKL
jgi:hypothetical protein